MKELDMNAADGEFSIAKGLPLCLIAGVLSAVYGIAINDTALPIVELAGKHGAGEWRTNDAYIYSNSGAITTTALYCLYLMKKEGTFREFLPTAARPRPILIAN
jgi:L-rhamnose-H+ transport protein